MDQDGGKFHLNMCPGRLLEPGALKSHLYTVCLWKNIYQGRIWIGSYFTMWGRETRQEWKENGKLQWLLYKYLESALYHSCTSCSQAQRQRLPNLWSRENFPINLLAASLALYSHSSATVSQWSSIRIRWAYAVWPTSCDCRAESAFYWKHCCHFHIMKHTRSERATFSEEHWKSNLSLQPLTAHYRNVILKIRTLFFHSH